MSGSTSFHGPIDGDNVLAGITVSGGTFNANFNRTDAGPRSPPVPKACRIIPFPRNEDVVHRPDLFAELETLLPATPEYHSAAVWGLGGSG